MLEISTKEFLSNPEKYLLGAAINDDFVSVQSKAGNAVIISEAEWNICIEALRAVLPAK